MELTGRSRHGFVATSSLAKQHGFYDGAVRCPRKCVYGTRPVSAHPLGAIYCLLVVSALELGLRHT